MRAKVSLLCLSLLAGVLTVVVPTTTARATYTPVSPSACVATLSGDSCSTSSVTATSLVITYTVTLTAAHPLCDGTQGPNQGKCTYSTFTSAGGDPGSASGQCLGRPIPGYSLPLTSSTFTCSMSFSWSATSYPSFENVGVVEQAGGGEDFFTDGNHSFKVTFPRPEPVVDFTAVADSNQSALWHFAATETTSSPATAYQWLIDDGNADTTPTMDHLFTQSGTYKITLHVTDSRNRRGDKDKQIDVTVTDLVAAVSITTPEGPGVGQKAVAHVTLSERAGGTSPITGITVDPGGITWGPAGVVTDLQPPSPAPPTSLNPGQSVSYDVTGTIAKAGSGTASISARGTEGSVTATAHASATADLARPDGSVEGTVLRGPAANHPEAPPHPAAGIAVHLTGATDSGVAVDQGTTTGADGTYALPVSFGTYTVTFPTAVCVVGPTTCTTSQAAKVAAASTKVTVDAIALASDLKVSLTTSPKKVELKRDKKTGKVTPLDVTFTVTVKNTGKSPVTDVTAVDRFVVGYHDPEDVNVPTVPVKWKSGPKPKAKVGTLKPGKSAKLTWVYTVKGDGDYDVDALVLGQQKGIGKITGRGTTLVKATSPVLEIQTSMGRKTTRRGGLIKAGTTFTIKLKAKNISYTKEIALEPSQLGLKGNAYDGHIEPAGYDISSDDLASVSSVRPSQWIVLKPRRSITLEGYVRTTSIPADLVTTGEEVGTGGTQATVKVTEPTVHLIDKGDVLGKEIPGSAVNIDGDTTFRVGIDDSDFNDPPPPSSLRNYFLAGGYFTEGVMEGLWNLTAGAVKGILVDLPVLLAKGVGQIPNAMYGYLRVEMELWDSIRDDPAKVLAYTNLLTNQVLLAYENAPFLAQKGQELYDTVNKEAFAHYEKMWNAYYHGDWRAAMREFGREGTERAGDVAQVVLTLGSGVLARSPQVRAAYIALKERTYAAVTEDLAAYAPKVLSAIESEEVLARLLKPGLELKDQYLRAFFGMTQREADFLRQFAKDNKLLIVVRSRAAESVKWIKAFGAALKPEAIKLKNVSWTDYKWLGFPESEIGRVSFLPKNKLPSEEELIAKLTKHGHGPGDPEYVEALDRLKTRLGEYKKTDAGYIQQLKELAKPKDGKPNGELTLNFNFAENGVDASHYTDVPMTYEFRIRKVGKVEVPEVKVGDLWRSFTGDIDFLQITHASGRPLLDAERVAVYQKLARSATGLLHPESATWTMLKNNAFSFPQKVNEFVRGGTCAQFGPDGIARAVKFVNDGRSYFKSKYRYYIEWDGGYVLPKS